MKRVFGFDFLKCDSRGGRIEDFNTINQDSIGSFVDFAIHNVDKVQTVAFQPISFTGRDEGVSDEWRVLCVEGMWFQDLWTYDFAVLDLPFNN